MVNSYYHMLNIYQMEYKLPLSLKRTGQNFNLDDAQSPQTTSFTSISSEGSEDKSACKILGHSLHAFSWKYPETTNLTRFTKSK